MKEKPLDSNQMMPVTRHLGEVLHAHREQMGLSQDVVARYKPDRNNSTNEVQVNLSDPGTESARGEEGHFPKRTRRAYRA